MAPRVDFKGRTIFTDTSFGNDAFLSGLGDANVSPLKDVTEGIDAGIKTGANILTLIDEFGPQAQERKKAELSIKQSDARIKQQQAELAAIQQEALAENRSAALDAAANQIINEKLSTQQKQELLQRTSSASKLLYDIPNDDFIGYKNARTGREVALAAADPEFAKALKRQDAIVRANAVVAARAGDRNAQELLEVFDSLAIDPLNQAKLDLQKRGQDITARGQTLRAQGSGSVFGKGGISPQNVAVAQRVTGESDPVKAVEVFARESREGDQGSIFFRDRELFSDEITALNRVQGVLSLRGARSQPQQPATPGTPDGSLQVVPPQQQAPQAPQLGPEAPRLTIGGLNGEAKSEQNILALSQQLGFDPEQGSEQREQVSKVLEIVDELEVDNSPGALDRTLLGADSLIEPLPRLKTMKVVRKAAKSLAEAEVEKIPENQLAAQINSERGTAGEVSRRDLEREKKSRAAALERGYQSQLFSAAEVLRAEKAAVLKTENDRIRTSERNQREILLLAQHLNRSPDEVRTVMLQSVQNLRRVPQNAQQPDEKLLSTAIRRGAAQVGFNLNR